MRLESRAGVRLTLLLCTSLAACSGGSTGGGLAATAVAPVSSATAATASTASGTAPPPATPTGPVRTAPAQLQTGPALVLDASGVGPFFDLPFPCDARRRANGAPDLTGLPNPRGQGFIRKAMALAEADTLGFSPTGTIYFRFDAPIVAPPDDPTLSLAPDSPVLLVDIDPASPERLRRHAFHARLTATADSIRPAHLLQVLPVPGLGLRPETTYAAIVLRRLGAPGAPFLGQHPDLTRLLAGQEPQAALGRVLARAYAPLAPALADLGIHPDDVAAATVFTTWDPGARLIAQVAHASRQGPPSLSRPLRQRDVFPSFTAIAGSFQAPQYQEGGSPFALSGGRQVVDAAGLPVRQYDVEAPFQLSIPKGRMPAAGFPLYFYVHGTGGGASQAIDRGRFSAPNVQPPPGSGLASWVTPEGWATACMAGPFSPDRIGFLAADGYLAYNFLNPVAMRDNFAQMILEQVHFRNLLLRLRIDPALCPGTDASAAPDGKIGFDPQLVIVGGQSLGSYLSGILAATVDGFQGAILTGAGGSWVEFGFGPVDPVDLHQVLDFLCVPAGESLDRFHPLIMVFDLAVGPADNTHYVPRILRRPLPGRTTTPHVLVVEGHRDLQVPTNLQRALVLALGADQGGPDVPNVGPDHQVAPVIGWGGRAQRPLPLTDNVTLPSGATRTAVMVRYPEDGIREGHHVWVQLDAPRRQIAEFVRDIAAGRAPVVR